MDEIQKTATPTETPTEAVTERGGSVAAMPQEAVATKSALWYVLVVVAICMVGIVVWFFLEKEGRVQTSVFSSLTAMVEKSEPVALVNGVEIAKVDFESNLKQLTANATQQGANVTDDAVLADLRTQAVESLVNTEILRQEAVKADFEATPEQVEEKYKGIETSLGGPEALTARMMELGVTTDMLRRDITNDIMIQALLEKEVDTKSVKVEEAEVKALYDQAGGESAGLPPFNEVKAQAEMQVRFQKEQALVAEYVAKLRTEVEVEVLN